MPHSTLHLSYRSAKSSLSSPHGTSTLLAAGGASGPVATVEHLKQTLSVTIHIRACSAADSLTIRTGRAEAVDSVVADTRQRGDGIRELKDNLS